MTSSMDAVVSIHREERLHLRALLSAAAASRLFVRQVCASWGLDQEKIDEAELLASELVSNAITASGVTDSRPILAVQTANMQLIGIRLLALDDGLVIEVWDTSPRPPCLIESGDFSEHGRGLQLVDALSIRWGYYNSGVSAKVVWCQLALGAAEPSPGGLGDVDAFERVLGTLARHPWDEHA